MPDLPNRDALEAEFSRKIGRLFSAFTGHLMEILEDAGWDVNNIPPSVWQGLTSEELSIFIPFVRKVALQTAEAMLETIPIGVDWALVNEGAATWAQNYSTLLAGQIDATSRRAVATSIRNSISAFYEEGLTMGDLIARMEADPKLMKLFTKDVRDSLGRVYGPRRAAMIARTEVTRAAMQGEVLIAQELAAQGIHMVAVWQTRNDELVCPICEPRNGKKKGDGWYNEEPAHPNCRCWINHELPE